MNNLVLLFLICSMLLSVSAQGSTAQAVSRQLRSEFLFRQTHYNEWINEYGKPIKRPNKMEIVTQIKSQIAIGAMAVEEGDAIMDILGKYPRKVPANYADFIRQALTRPAPPKPEPIPEPAPQLPAPVAPIAPIAPIAPVIDETYTPESPTDTEVPDIYEPEEKEENGSTPQSGCRRRRSRKL